MSGFKYPENFGGAVFSGRYVKTDYVLEKYLVPGSGDYVLPAALFMPVEKQHSEVVLMLHGEGMQHAARSDPQMIHGLLQQGYSVLLFDVPGIGSLGPGYLRGDAYIDNTSFNQWFAGIHTAKSIVAMRAEDIIRMLHFAKTELYDFKTVSALAVGPVGSEILHAAVFDEAIGKVCLVQPFLSFADIALSWEYSPAFVPSTVAGAIDHYDLPDLMAALCPRKVLILDPLSANGDPAGDEVKSCYLSYPEIVFTQKGVKGNFTHAVGDKNQPVPGQILDWLK
jgi:pimeloyl-ACP methyl ester carboxylesterase